MSSSGAPTEQQLAKQAIDQLKRIYREKVLPLESLYKYDEFYSPFISDSEFDAKPSVLMIGQYSTGKTSFIKYLLGRDFPGQRVGPEPTTDRFVAVMHGPDDRIIPGNALAVQADLPFRGLQRFGTTFLNKFEAAQLTSPVLSNINIIDTPGILSGEKQRTSRGYDFVEVCRWFAERSDLILLLFDAHKLDISDEFQSTIESLKGMDDKVRCILNKADQIDRQKLMRVYGALMWSMGKVLKTPEVLRVYVGSFWDQPLVFEDNASLFEAEENDLMNDLRSLPRNSAMRKINEMVKRTRLAKVHAYLIAYLRDQMPTLTGHSKKQAQLIQNMPEVFRVVQKQYNVPTGDFPDLNKFRQKLEGYQFSKFPKLKPRMITELDNVLASDVPRLIAMLPRGDMGPSAMEQAAVAASQQAQVAPPAAPTMGVPGAGAGAVRHVDEWEVAAEKPQYDEIFFSSGPVNGKLSGAVARNVLMSTGVPVETLGKIWELADMDRDGELDGEEFAVAMHLINMVLAGGVVPVQLTVSMIPPSKRNFMIQQ